MCRCLGCICCAAGMEWSKSAAVSGTAALQVRGNADYIVDGLCRQLRHLENHPRCSTPLVPLKAVLKSKA